MTVTTPFQIYQFYTKGVVVDTNLMILYVVGLYDIKLISRHPKTKTFIQDDFITLCQIIDRFKKILTTPNILTETSNLSEKYDENFKLQFFNNFEKIIETLDERYTPSKDLSKQKIFKKLGLANGSLADLAAKGYLILTDDLNLYGYLLNLNLPVVNFNQIRGLTLLK